MREYFESAWRAYRRLRPGAPPRPPAGLFARFARLRPLVESGWEMPVLIHALRAGASRASLLRDWRPDAWLADLAATREAVGAALDRVRDEWIAHDETGWLASHAFYPGVIEPPRRPARARGPPEPAPWRLGGHGEPPKGDPDEKAAALPAAPGHRGGRLGAGRHGERRFHERRRSRPLRVLPGWNHRQWTHRRARGGSRRFRGGRERESHGRRANPERRWRGAPPDLHVHVHGESQRNGVRRLYDPQRWHRDRELRLRPHRQEAGGSIRRDESRVRGPGRLREAVVAAHAMDARRLTRRSFLGGGLAVVGARVLPPPAARAVVLGKTNVPPAAADWQSYNEVFGVSNNPWDLARTPGGSTGGGAAALAAGLTYLEPGSDLGGSIRVPAHFCGVYGHKPTLGVVPLRGHIPPPPGTPPGPPPLLPVAGPLARSAADLRAALEARA